MIDEKTCAFCTETKPCVTVVNDGKTGNVCKECLNHLFDEFDSEMEEE